MMKFEANTKTTIYPAKSRSSVMTTTTNDDNETIVHSEHKLTTKKCALELEIQHLPKQKFDLKAI